VPWILLSDCDCPRRAGAGAGTTTGAAFLVQLRERNATGSRDKADRPGRALIAADPAFNPFFRQTIGVDGGTCCPRRLILVPDQGARSAGGNAVAAKSAFAMREIDHWITGITLADDLCRARCNAVSATRTGIQEVVFGARPGRAQWCLAKREFAA
jgi:hypothetical protein